MRSATIEEMDIWLIGAAPVPPRSPPPRAPLGEHDIKLRMFNSVKNDLDAMYRLCHEPRFSLGRTHSRLNIRQCLVNHGELRPTLAPTTKLDETVYQAQVYRSVKKVRRAVTSFIEDWAGPNLLIYFSGHGATRARSRSASRSCYVEGRLCLPVSVRRKKGELKALALI